MISSQQRVKTTTIPNRNVSAQTKATKEYNRAEEYALRRYGVESELHVLDALPTTEKCRHQCDPMYYFPASKIQQLHEHQQTQQLNELLSPTKEVDGGDHRRTRLAQTSLGRASENDSRRTNKKEERQRLNKATQFIQRSLEESSSDNEDDGLFFSHHVSSRRLIRDKFSRNHSMKQSKDMEEAKSEEDFVKAECDGPCFVKVSSRFLNLEDLSKEVTKQLVDKAIKGEEEKEEEIREPIQVPHSPSSQRKPKWWDTFLLSQILFAG